MKYMPGKENPTDWNSRHSESIDEWSGYQRKKHNVDDGEEISLNRIVAVKKLDKILADAGIKGSKPWSIDNIIEVGKRDEEYSSTKKLVAEGTAQ